MITIHETEYPGNCGVRFSMEDDDMLPMMIAKADIVGGILKSPDALSIPLTPQIRGVLQEGHRLLWAALHKEAKERQPERAASPPSESPRP